MRFFSTDPDVPGVIAVGQFATGIIALGQVAVGVVAIGQIARGVFAVGQVAVGVVAIGQAALGMLYGGGMIAVAGRGFGVVLKVLPEVALLRYERPRLPRLVSLDSIAKGLAESGNVLARIVEGRLRIDGAFPELELSAAANLAIAKGLDAEHNHACVRVVARSEVRGADDGAYRRAVERARVLTVPHLTTWAERTPHVELSGPFTDVGGLMLRGFAFAVLVVAWAAIVGGDVLDILRAM